VICGKCGFHDYVTLDEPDPEILSTYSDTSGVKASTHK
jgi:hypothetical protein